MSEKKPSLPSVGNFQHRILVEDIVQLIRQGQRRVASEVNATFVLLYWTIGKRINDEILIDKRADYGNQIIDTVSAQLSLQFGKGYSRSGLFRIIRFAKLYPDNQIVATVSRQLSWSHVVLLCQMDEEIKRDFYLKMASKVSPYKFSLKIYRGIIYLEIKKNGSSIDQITLRNILSCQPKKTSKRVFK